MDISKINADAFQAEVLDWHQPVLVDFTAVWCGPCKMLDPIVKQLAQEWDGKVKVVKVDVDDNQDLAMNYNIMGVPTLMLFVKGKLAHRISGYQPKDKILRQFLPHLSS
ncbi:MAG: thioredoxin [Anaerolineales bacterium]|jgi:thioredoxin 1|nr:thioredoxin [Anaerolineales bacterium]